ncbi:hypothetical protein VNO77_19077 [Canavalia gladiata]|uniref:Uncharacterized protein n=1 Tax=Canavalia gladiata TaxID=3824 RepID=A0AAN9LQW8_CANGL
MANATLKLDHKPTADKSQGSKGGGCLLEQQNRRPSTRTVACCRSGPMCTPDYPWTSRNVIEPETCSCLSQVSSKREKEKVTYLACPWRRGAAMPIHDHDGGDPTSQRRSMGWSVLMEIHRDGPSPCEARHPFSVATLHGRRDLSEGREHSLSLVAAHVDGGPAKL